jgi:hypothetical protein
MGLNHAHVGPRRKEEADAGVFVPFAFGKRFFSLLVPAHDLADFVDVFRCEAAKHLITLFIRVFLVASGNDFFRMFLHISEELFPVDTGHGEGQGVGLDFFLGNDFPVTAGAGGDVAFAGAFDDDLALIVLRPLAFSTTTPVTLSPSLTTSTTSVCRSRTTPFSVIISKIMRPHHSGST